MKNISLLIVTLFLFTGCAANKILSSYSNPETQSYTLESVLIIGVAAHETKRHIYENTFAESLTKKGVKSVPSYTVSQQPIQPTRESLVKVISRSAAKTVLVTHLVGKDEKLIYTPGTTYIHNGNTYGSGLYGYYPFVFNTIHSPGSYKDTTKVILETSLYDVATERLIWTARTESIDPVMTKKYYQMLIDLFLEDLQETNLLK